MFFKTFLNQLRKQVHMLSPHLKAFTGLPRIPKKLPPILSIVTIKTLSNAEIVPLGQRLSHGRVQQRHHGGIKGMVAAIKSGLCPSTNKRYLAFNPRYASSRCSQAAVINRDRNTGVGEMSFDTFSEFVGHPRD